VSPRLVFGQSLSPDEIRRIQRATVQSCCGMKRTIGYRPITVQECAACRGRFVCGVRRDDLAAARWLMGEAENAMRRACIDGDRCPDFLEFKECIHTNPSFPYDADEEATR
jgi:hypothetical protein